MWGVGLMIVESLATACSLVHSRGLDPRHRKEYAAEVLTILEVEVHVVLVFVRLKMRLAPVWVAQVDLQGSYSFSGSVLHCR